MNRGSAFHQNVDVGRARPSMRPRFMNRGSAKERLGIARAAAAFNEAPIHESGKFLWLRQDMRDYLHPSMRPRFMNRGSIVNGAARAMHPRPFNEAPIHESGKYCSRRDFSRRSATLQ